MAQITLNSTGVASNGSLVLQSNGTTTAVTIDASQNVGIGTSSPSQRVDSTVSSSTEGSGLGVTNSRVDGYGSGISFYSTATDSTKILAGQVGMRGTGTWANTANASSAMTFSTVSAGTNAEKMRIDSSGNVGIGTASPSGRLAVAATGGAGLIVGQSNDNFYASTNHRFYDLSYTNERMRIDSSGNLLVGTTSVQDGSRLQVRGSGDTSGTKAFLVEDSGGNDDFFIRGDGEMYSLPTYNRTSASAANVGIDAGGGFFRSTSSIKYKTDVQDATHGLAEVIALRPVTYKGINDGELIFGGLIAEEVHEAGLTEFVQYADDGTPDALAYGNMISLCIKAIQEQQALITQLTTRITALEAK